MARVRGGLLSLEASGAIGGAMIFASWKGRQYVRKFVVSANPRSGDQVGVRSNFAGCVAAFKELSEGDEALWKVVADKLSWTPLNAMVSVAQKNLQALMGMQELPTRIDDTAPEAPTTAAAEKSGNKAILTWVDSVAADLYGTYIYRSPTAVFTAGPGNLVGVVLAGVEEWAETPGLGTWYWQLKADDVDGNLGVPTAEVTLTFP
jgi:hypothetical protein